MNLDDFLRARSNPMPVPKPGEWINVFAVKHTLKYSKKYFSMVACICGLSSDEGKRWSEALPHGPNKELSCNRLAWLKWLSTCTKMCLNIIEAEIKKIESEKK